MLANECCCGQRLNPKLTGRVTLQHSKGENVIVMCAQLAFWHKSGSKGKVKDLLKCKSFYGPHECNCNVTMMLPLAFHIGLHTVCHMDTYAVFAL